VLKFPPPCRLCFNMIGIRSNTLFIAFLSRSSPLNATLNPRAAHMNEFVRLFRAFLYRDLAFILGGSIVIASVASAFPGGFWAQVSSLEKLPSAFLVLFAAMAYVVGYAVQDIGGVLGITFTGHPFNPERMPCWFYCWTGVSWTSIPCWLYKRFTNTRWKGVSYIQDNETPYQFEIRIDRLDVPEATSQRIERILSLKVIGMCVGSCGLLSSLILLPLWLFWRSVPGLLVVGLFLLGVALICLGWVKAMQQLQFYQAIHLAGYPLKAPKVAIAAETKPEQ
jgi:hypothetical protein